MDFGGDLVEVLSALFCWGSSSYNFYSKEERDGEQSLRKIQLKRAVFLFEKTRYSSKNGRIQTKYDISSSNEV